MSDTPLVLPARFDSDAWDRDIARADSSGRAAAETARDRYERDGVPVEELRQVQDEGPDGTILPNCVKVYLPPPAGRFGMVFEVVRAEEKLRWNTSHSAYDTRPSPTPQPSTSLLTSACTPRSDPDLSTTRSSYPSASPSQVATASRASGARFSLWIVWPPGERMISSLGIAGTAM